MGLFVFMAPSDARCCHPGEENTVIELESERIPEDEQIDDLQLAGLRILQKKKTFRYGMDSVLLADFAVIRPEDRVADLGSGTGILPLLLLGRGKGRFFDAIEFQRDMAEMSGRSMALNHLTQQVTIHCMRVEEALSVLKEGSVDSIVCNPPYGVPGGTLLNPSSSLAASRHQDVYGLIPWYQTAHRLLKPRGRFHMIYPAARMLDAMEDLRVCHLEPKRFRLVYPRADKPPNLVLLEARRDVRPMLHPEPPLIVRNSDGTITDEIRRIYHESSGRDEKTCGM